MTADYISLLDNISPNLKLSHCHIIPVLEQISKGEPDRRKVARNIIEAIFPDKTKKSVFRGMVVPTMTELHLARKDTNKRLFYFSPNGKAVIFSSDQRTERLGYCLRDYAVIELNLIKEAIDYLVDNRSELKKTNPNLEAKAIRFKNQFLDPFDITLPSASDLEDEKILSLYRTPSTNSYVQSSAKRRQWIVGCFSTHQLNQVDEARWKMIKWQLNEGNMVSSWFVDEALWREWQSSSSIIDLWEASTRSDSQLIRGGTPYDGVLLKETSP